MEDQKYIIESFDDYVTKPQKKSNKMTNTGEHIVSLYEYLHRAAGAELGKRVNIAAMNNNEEQYTREVSTQTYKGTIQMYRREFLDEYFAHNR